MVPGSLEAPPDPRWLEGVDVLVHLAALGVQSRDRDWSAAAEANVTRSLALVRAARVAGVSHVVATGTCLEYRGHGVLPDRPVSPRGGAPRCDEDTALEPTDAYGASKAAGGLMLRAWAREAEMPLWYLRYASIYGPGDDAAKFLPAAVRTLRGDGDFSMSGGEQVREWLYIDDALRALELAITTAPDDVRTLNIGTGSGVELRTLVGEVVRRVGADPARVRPTLPYRRHEAHHLVMDVERSASVLGWQATTTLDAGLHALLATAGEDGTRRA